jgi:hypothetical protein
MKETRSISVLFTFNQKKKGIPCDPIRSCIEKESMVISTVDVITIATDGVFDGWIEVHKVHTIFN